MKKHVYKVYDCGISDYFFHRVSPMFFQAFRGGGIYHTKYAALFPNITLFIA